MGIKTMSSPFSGFTKSTIWSFLYSIKEWQLFIGLLCYAFFIRFPFFFRDYVDRDESTFILMGQSWVDGNLPYTELWDLKPPITFFFFATIIYVFGKSFIAIRIAGTFLVAIVAFFTFKIGDKLGYKSVALWSAILVVLLLSLFGSLQGVMSEHICMAFFMPGIYYYLFKRKFSYQYLAGLLIGLALMSKLNMAYPIAFMMLYTLWPKKGFKSLLKKTRLEFFFGLGVLTILFATALPYYFKGDILIWWESVFQAPMAYSKALDRAIYKPVPVVIAVSVFLVYAWKKKLLNFKSRKLWIFILLIFGTLFSFFKAGKMNGHYLIQLHPILILLVFPVLYKIDFFKNFKVKNYIFLLLFLLPIETYIEAANVIKTKQEKNRFMNGEGISVPLYLKKNQIDYHPIFFTEYHIGNWLLEEKPPTKIATHPSNIMREILFPYARNERKTSQEELQYIMQQIQPKIIVRRKNRPFFDGRIAWANDYMAIQIQNNYKVLDTIEQAILYQRLPSN